MTTLDKLPLQPAAARKIVIELVNDKPQWLRSDLSKAMVDRHIASGGILGQQAPANIAKKVLRYLEQ